MANRYWVGGTANWDATAGTKWALTSGGAGGQAVPTGADDVFFDSFSSPSTIVTVAALGSAKSINFTGYPGRLAGTSGLNVGSNLTFDSGMSLTWTGPLTLTGTGTLTTNGISLNGSVTFSFSTGTFTLGSALTTTGTVTLTSGTLTTSASNYNITCNIFSSSGASTRTLNLNSSLLTITGSGTSFNTGTTTGLTVSGSGTVRFTSASAKTFAGGGFNFGSLTVTNAGAGALTFTGSNTIGTLSNSVQPTTFSFTAGTTTTLTNWNVSGTAGNLVTIQSPTAATHTLSKASGTVSADYLSITNSTATGGATWYAGANSTNVSGNTGWIFSGPPSGNLSGSSNVSFSTSGVAVGAGILAGSSDPAFSTSGIVTGTGILAGSSDPAFSTSGITTGTGALVGSSDAAFSLSGVLTATGNLSGSTDLTFTATATPFAPTPPTPTPTPTPSRNVGGTLYALPMEDPLDKVRERDEKELVEIIGILVTMGVFHGDV